MEKLTVGTPKYVSQWCCPAAACTLEFACCLEDGEKGSLYKFRYPPGVLDRTLGGLLQWDRVGDEQVTAQLVVNGAHICSALYPLLLYSAHRREQSLPSIET